MGAMNITREDMVRAGLMLTLVGLYILWLRRG